MVPWQKIQDFDKYLCFIALVKCPFQAQEELGNVKNPVHVNFHLHYISVSHVIFKVWKFETFPMMSFIRQCFHKIFVPVYYYYYF